MQSKILKRALTIGAAVAFLGLAGCGTSPGDRFVSGAGMGAGAGAITGALVPGMSAGTGALVGGLVGGGVGAMTNPNQVYMGRPVWRQ
jgi:hypothetical protein